jgi:Protein of unknown function (DUF1573)
MSTITSRGAVFALTVLLFQNMVVAQELSWAEKMFDKHKVDLGVVARGADVHYYVKVKNIYKEAVHISNIRTTCGCTAAKVAKRTIKTHETALIDLEINTRKFMRRKDTNVIVTFDKPLYAEVRIPLTVYIRTDVVFTPGCIEFGNVEKGQGLKQTINVAYSGRSSWTIKDIKNKNPNIDIKIEEKSRVGRNVNYQLICTLKPTAPAGKFNQQITLVTDDASNPYVPVIVKGNVETDIVLTPLVQKMGQMEPGKQKTFRIVLKGKKPFSVTEIECESNKEAFKMKLPKGKRPVFAIPFSFTAPETPGKFSEEFTITIAGRDEPLIFKAVGVIKAKN